MMSRVVSLVVLLVLVAAGLPVATAGGSDSGEATGAAFDSLDNADRCDVLDDRYCLLPFPSNFFTRADPTTDTGLRIDFQTDSMPVNKDGLVVDPANWNLNDGFSPGSAALVQVADVDLAASGAAPIGDIGRSLEADAPVVLIDAETGERHPYWVELDANADNDVDRLLVVQPAINLEAGRRYIVALRDLVDGVGEPVPVFPGFEAFRDSIPTGIPEVEARRPAMEEVLTTLEGFGVARSDLIIAWDFTVASQRGLSERLLFLRDDAFASLGGESPTFTVTGVDEAPTEGIARDVRGTFEIPSYLTNLGGPGNGFNYDASGMPQQSGVTLTAPFVCRIPDAAVANPPARPAIYGHGLLGSHTEVYAGNVRDFAVEANIAFCATDWIGMANEDILNAASILQNFGRFPTLADRSQQGILNTLFLGRLLVHENGFVSNPAFQADDGTPLVDTRRLFFDGNSQGAIMGGAATAVAQDWRDAVLGVPGMNYSVLIPRSRDFDAFLPIVDTYYPDQLEQSLLLALAQMLWDRAETNGYAANLTTDPLPNTPPHRILMQAAFGDQQVTTYAAEIQARTIGAKIYQPALAPGRSPDADPFWGLEPVDSFPYVGSVLVMWDSGAAPPPVENVPPRVGFDPHEDPRADADARRQKSEFLQIYGWVTDVCDAAPCIADGN